MSRQIKYPVGIQSFEKLRTEGYAYVDKTGFIPRLLDNCYYFLSRPRRFGKSLFLSTLEAFFKGRKDLFEGLAVYEWEKDWVEYPVFHLDLNFGEYSGVDGLRGMLDDFLTGLEKTYGRNTESRSPAIRLKNLLEAAHARTGRKVVVLVDEYEKPVLSAAGDEKLQDDFRALLKPFYSVLKTCDQHIHFAMLTGVSRLGKMSVFSDLNNLIDLSMKDYYAGICGVTRDELLHYFKDSLRDMSRNLGLDIEQTVHELRKAYDGYRFSEKGPKVFNPFSLFNCFLDERIDDYWFATGTPTFLVKTLKKCHADLWNLDGVEVSLGRLADVDSFEKDVIPLLYQSGYLTIKEYYPEFRMARLGFPNEEVKRGFTNSLMKYYMDENRDSSALFILTQCFKKGDIDGFMQEIKSMFASVPYVEAKDFNYEGEFRNIMYIVLSMLGFHVDIEKHIHTGRIDIVAKTSEYIYIMEFKTGGTPDEALAQIFENHYADAYLHDKRRLYAVGAVFSSEQRNIAEWKAELIQK